MDSTDAVDLLSSRVRQAVVRELHREAGSLGTAELARRLTERRDILAIAEPDDAIVQLFHVHLPKMAESDAIEYDRRSGEIVLTDDGERLVELLAFAEATFGDRVRNAVEP